MILFRRNTARHFRKVCVYFTLLAVFILCNLLNFDIFISNYRVSNKISKNICTTDNISSNSIEKNVINESDISNQFNITENQENYTDLPIYNLTLIDNSTIDTITNQSNTNLSIDYELKPDQKNEKNETSNVNVTHKTNKTDNILTESLKHFDFNKKVEYTEDKEMSKIDYSNRTTSEPLIPKNFDIDIEGVAALEISPGVHVLHNYSAIRSNRSFVFNNIVINVTTFDSGFMKEHFVFLPPFDWQLPLGLTEEQRHLFWKQPEDHWHFDDANMIHTGVVWEIKNGEMPICDEKTCQNHNYTHHLNFCRWPRQTSNPSFNGNLFAFGGHDIEIFQHFFDNGVPHMAFMSFATGREPKDINLITAACNGVTLAVLRRLGFSIINKCQNSGHVSATNLIVIPSMRVLHPLYYEWYYSKMNLPNKKKDKIVIIPRGGGSGGGNARIIYNVRDIKAPLAKVHGESNVVIHSGSKSLDNLIDLFGSAKVIVGPHGGAFYNQFFAGRDTDIIEMIPQLGSGKYPLQKHWDRLIPFAHLSMYSNTLLLGQRFWRYITMNADINYNINISDFLSWSQQIPTIRGDFNFTEHEQIQTKPNISETISQNQTKINENNETTAINITQKTNKTDSIRIDSLKHFDFSKKVEYTKDEEMSEIDYSYRTTPEPLIPKNFDIDIEGVAALEISPGVHVLHNYSAIRSDRYFVLNDTVINITTFDSGFMKEHFVFLPPFDWYLPLGLTEKQRRLFWKQPENHWHFDDANMIHTGVVWEIKNGEMPLCEEEKCENHNYTHHLNFCHWPKQTNNPSFNGNLFAFGGHYIEIFQHFFDNGVPHMAFMSFATGLEPQEVNLATAACNGVTLDVLRRLGFSIAKKCQSSGHFSATNLIVIPSLTTLHPLYYEWYYSKMNLPIRKKDKIVIIPRGDGSGGGNARIIYNVRDIKAPLATVHGENNVIIHSESKSLDSLIELFSTAKVIVGPHGGAFYNQFFAGRDTDIIEMIPQLSSGKYPLQKHWDRLIPFAHLSMYSNTLMLGQRFWRYITMDADINYNIDISDFLSWSQQIPTIRGDFNYTEPHEQKNHEIVPNSSMRDKPRPNHLELKPVERNNVRRRRPSVH